MKNFPKSVKDIQMPREVTFISMPVLPWEIMKKAIRLTSTRLMTAVNMGRHKSRQLEEQSQRRKGKKKDTIY